MPIAVQIVLNGGTGHVQAAMAGRCKGIEHAFITRTV